jgi:hypothetical protein
MQCAKTALGTEAHNITKRNNADTPRSRSSVLIALNADLEWRREVKIMNRSQKVRHSEERGRQEGIIIYPAANQQGCATVPFVFAQPVEQREMVKLPRRAVTESPGVMPIAGQSVLL